LKSETLHFVQGDKKKEWGSVEGVFFPSNWEHRPLNLPGFSVVYFNIKSFF